MNNLAGTIAAQGDLAAARALLDHAIDTLHREFGPIDPDTLIALANLAAVLWQFGERGEAYWLQSQLVETRRQAFGDTDAGTRAAVACSRRCTATTCREPPGRSSLNMK